MTTKETLMEVYEQVNWAYLAKNYFGKTRSWLYHKFAGMNNGVPDDFNDIDRNTLREALYDMSDKIRSAADRL